MPSESLRIGIDVGGTNTDAVIMSGRQVLAAHKTATTPDVGSAPAFATFKVNVAGLTVVFVPSTFNSVPRECVAEIDRSAAAIAGDAVTNSVVAMAATRRPGRPGMDFPPMNLDF